MQGFPAAEYKRIAHGFQCSLWPGGPVSAGSVVRVAGLKAQRHMGSSRP